jgi:thiosulfate/3-mercaptopyruvate sulfurtransferase
MQISLITPEELDKLTRQSSEVRIIDARSRAEFEAGRIPDAIWMGWEDWCSPAPDHLGPMLKQPGYWGEMCSIDRDIIGQQLSLLGLSNKQEIVVYADGAKSKGREGRIAWMLLYLGAAQVKILNGGIGLWSAQGYPTDRKMVAAKPGSFHVEIQHQRRILMSTLREALGTKKMPVMLDTRSILEHIGDLHRYMPRRGRIPESELIAYPSLFNPDGTFVGPEEYLSLLPEKVKNGNDVVAYCEVGPRACMVALLHELYTGHVLPVYEGSMMQWSADPDMPVEKLSKES